MFRKLRRRLAHRSIRNFLKEYLPNIELGELEEFKCLDFRLGQYSVKTTKGEYKMHFWELLNSAKEFSLDLCEWKNGEWESITFSITGNIIFKIVPSEFTIDRVDKRQVTILTNGKSTIWPLGKESSSNYNLYKVYRKPIMWAEKVDLSRIIRLNYKYA